MKKLLIPMCSVITLLVGCSSKETEESQITITPTVKIKQEITFKEPESGSSVFLVPIELNTKAPFDFTISYSSQSISATSGTDFQPLDGVLTFLKGESKKNVEIVISGDDVDENDETFRIDYKLTNSDVEFYQSSNSIIEIADSDDESIVSFGADLVYASEGAGEFEVTINITPASEKEITIPFSVGGLASLGTDYELNSPQTLIIPQNTLKETIKLNILSDNIREGGESIALSLKTPLNAKLGVNKETVIIIPGDLGLNDTGLIEYYDPITDEFVESPSTLPHQDAGWGRDVTNANPVDGHAGFSYSKVDSSGNAIPSNETATCFKDNITGLTWEIKEPAQELPQLNGDALRDHLAALLKAEYPYNVQHHNWKAVNYRYYWYEENSKINGGSSGAKGDSFVNSSYPISSNCAFENKDSTSYLTNVRSCSTTDYIKAMNSLAVCSYKNWTLPTVSQLRTLFNYNLESNSSTDFIGHIAKGDYITSSPYANSTGAVWCVNSESGRVKLCNKQHANFVRLVRTGAQ